VLQHVDEKIRDYHGSDYSMAIVLVFVLLEVEVIVVLEERLGLWNFLLALLLFRFIIFWL